MSNSFTEKHGSCEHENKYKHKRTVMQQEKQTKTIIKYGIEKKTIQQNDRKLMACSQVWTCSIPTSAYGETLDFALTGFLVVGSYVS